MAKSEKNKKKMSKNTKTLIAVIAAVVILVGAMLAVVFLMPTCQGGDENEMTEATYPTDDSGKQYAVDAKGNKIDDDEGVLRDDKGNIISDGIVEITNQGPLLVTKIEIENESGSYTVLCDTPTEKTTDEDGNETTKTDETVYTLVGFENAELQGDQMSSVANRASNMETISIIDKNGENLADYGLDEPRAKVKTTFSDGKTVNVSIGNDAPDNQGTYIMYGDKKTVYMIDVEAASVFLFSPLDLLSKEITDAAETEESAEIESVTLSGKIYPEAVTIVPNDDETCQAYYKMTEPKEQFVNVTNGQEILGGIRGLYATGVVAYHPSKERLAKLGLDEPEARLKAKYSDAEYSLIASKPDGDGNVNLYNEKTKIAYKLEADSVAWVSSGYEKLKYEYVLKPVEEKLSAIEISAGGKSYKFDLEQKTTTDDEGNEQSSMKISCGGKTLTESRFSTFFDNLVNVQRSDSAEDEKPVGEAVMTVKYSYSNGKDDDTVSYYKAENRKMLAVINGSSDSHVFETYTSKIIEDAAKAAEGGNVTPI